MNKQSIVYQIIRCKRKSTALYVKVGGNVVVRAPFFVSNEQIDGFVQSHYLWILQKQSEQQNLQQKKERFSVTDQDTLTVLGREYPVVYGNQVHFNGTVFEIPQIPFSQIKPQVIAEYKRLAKEIITERGHYFSELTGWKAESIKIGNAKTRWGSCSGTKSSIYLFFISYSPYSNLFFCILFNSLIVKSIFSDLNTIDYVVLHELAHTKEHNHSQRFWNLVAEYMPNYKEIRERLIAVQKKLMQENWD